MTGVQTCALPILLLSGFSWPKTVEMVSHFYLKFTIKFSIKFSAKVILYFQPLFTSELQ